MAIVRLTKKHIDRRKVGPWSRTHVLATIDCRTQVGRHMKALSLELAGHVGTPTVAQRVLIQQAAVKSAKLGMLVDKILSDSEPDVDLATRCYLAWSNSLRRDLEALGLKQPEKQVPAIADFLKAQKARPGRDAA